MIKLTMVRVVILSDSESNATLARVHFQEKKSRATFMSICQNPDLFPDYKTFRLQKIKKISNLHSFSQLPLS